MRVIWLLDGSRNRKISRLRVSTVVPLGVVPTNTGGSPLVVMEPLNSRIAGSTATPGRTSNVYADQEGVWCERARACAASGRAMRSAPSTGVKLCTVVVAD